jgi:hypothetical protein
MLGRCIEEERPMPAIGGWSASAVGAQVHKCGSSRELRVFSNYDRAVSAARSAGLKT